MGLFHYIYIWWKAQNRALPDGRCSFFYKAHIFFFFFYFDFDFPFLKPAQQNGFADDDRMTESHFFVLFFF